MNPVLDGSAGIVVKETAILKITLVGLADDRGCELENDVSVIHNLIEEQARSVKKSQEPAFTFTPPPV